MKKVLIIAGEASSDMHAANLVSDIKALNREIVFFGLGGSKMKDVGVDMLEEIAHLAFIGPGGLFKHYLQLRKIYYSLLRRIKSDPPDCAILIDYAEFNLRVAKELKSLGIPIIYYISPQVWAWGLWRIKTIRRLVDKMLVFFKFEEKLYKKHNVDVAFVGHPLMGTVKTTKEEREIEKDLNIEEAIKAVGILPGSRNSEIKNILPTMLEACKLISKELKEEKITFILPLAPTVDESIVREMIEKSSVAVTLVKENYYNAISICDCAMVTSGTATLETALLGIPMAIIYKANFLTYILTKNLIQLPYIGLVNVVAGEKIAPEFLQHDATPEKISKYIIRLMRNNKERSSLRKRFLELKDSLGEPGASKRAAGEVVNFL